MHVHTQACTCIILHAHIIFVKHTIYSPVFFTAVLFIAE